MKTTMIALMLAVCTPGVCLVAQSDRGEVSMENRTKTRMIWLWIDGDKKCAALINLHCESQPTAGGHTLEAKDSSDKVIKKEQVTVERGRVFTWTVTD